jgi:HK97 gp10 family phage protein
MTNIQVIGEDELRAKLKSLSTAIATDGIEQAVLAGAYVVEAAAKLKAPVDTGFLRSSIQASILNSTRSSAEAIVAAQALYAIYVEMGTVNMRAQPYLRPALDENRGSIINAVTTTLARFIVNEVGS